MTLDEVKKILKSNNLSVVSENRSGNGYGTVLNLVNGCIVNHWDKGTISFQGKNCDNVKPLFDTNIKKATKKFS